MSEMTREMEFFIFLLEHYAQYKGTTADKVLSEWDSLKITETINQMYERYHCEALENAFADIDDMIAEKKKTV